MDFQTILTAARGQMGPCKACPVCNGLACKNTMPGPGAKGSGTVAARNYAKWQDIRVNLDTICVNRPVDITTTLFGKSFRMPVFAGPVGAVNLHYGDKYNDQSYNDILVSACAKGGVAAFTGDGADPDVMKAATRAISAAGVGVPTVKPWDPDTLREKLALANDCGAFALAMDIDAAGLPFLKKLGGNAGSKTVAELAEVVRGTDLPFIVKGVMTVSGAKKALEAGAQAIIVSNHGGRVLDHTPATAEVLGDIVDAVGGKMTILVDGGIRTGMDVFKALALGADGALIARPFVCAVFGGGEEGVLTYLDQLAAELTDVMSMCGAHSIGEISREMLWHPLG